MIYVAGRPHAECATTFPRRAMLGFIIVLSACISAAPNLVEAGTDGASLRLRNESTAVICYVYVSPASQASWGPDRLQPDEIIDPGATREWTFPPGRYDLRLIDCNRDVLMQRSGVELAGDGAVLTFRARE